MAQGSGVDGPKDGIVNYLSDEQRSQTGWIGVQKCEVILKRALSRAISPPFGFFDRSGETGTTTLQ
jgi:hypothetical protein